MIGPIDSEQLLAESHWLTALARRLAGNAADADDLVQETLRSAVTSPPTPDRPLRGWLHTVLRRHLLDWRRAESARYRRDAGSGGDTSAPPAAEVVAKAEAHRLLVDAVLALDEPYRTTVLLRFFEGLPPRTIARRMQCPVATVDSRLQRALDRLRARLASHRADWRTAIAPLFAPTHLAVLFGASAVNVATSLAVGLTTILVVALAWPRAEPPPPASAPVMGGEVATPANSAAVETGATTHERAAAIPEPPAVVAAVARAARGRVIDVHGIGVPGVELGFAGEAAGAERSAPVRSNANGAFDASVSPTARSVHSVDPRWATVLSGLVRDGGCTVVVAPRVDLAGRVVGVDGTPIPGAAVRAHLPAQLGADLGVVLDFSTPRTWRVVCDELGRFQLPDVPAVPLASLVAELGGYVPRITAVPQSSTALLELVLERPRAAVDSISGLVVDRFGAAVQGARVSAGAAIARTDDRGAFLLDLEGAALANRLVALARGWQPAVLVPPTDASGAVTWPARVVLRLGDEVRSVVGTVESATGKPAAGARVWIADPLFVGTEDDAVLAENATLGEGRPFWAFVQAGADGTFRIDGLSDRAYTLRAVDPASLCEATLPNVAAGRSDVVLRLSGEVFEHLCARVVFRDGTPAAGVQVRLQRPALEVRVPDGTRDEWANREPVHTDSDGRAVFHVVPTSGVELFASGDTIVFAGRMIEPGDDPRDFVLAVDRRLHLQVELAPPTDRADRCRVLDERGEAMVLRIMRGNASQTSRAADLVDGRSHILSLGEGARTVVFLRGGVEVGRMPVALRPHDVTTVTF